jgi:hypothetical protein
MMKKEKTAPVCEVEIVDEKKLSRQKKKLPTRSKLS